MRVLYLESEHIHPAFSEACLSLTPKVYRHKDKELFLELSATEKLFGGELKMLEKLERLREIFAVPLKSVLTDRPEWAKAFSFSDRVELPRGGSYERLLALSIDRLAYCGDPAKLEEEWDARVQLIAFMRRVGLTLIQDFVSLPPAAIHRRFGKLGEWLHQWATGTRELKLPLYIPQQGIVERLDTDDVLSLEALLLGLGPCFKRLEERLTGRGLLAKEVKFSFYLESGSTEVKHLKLSDASRETARLLSLTGEFLSKVSWESPLQRLEISIQDAVPFTSGQLSLLDLTENRMPDLGAYIDRLQERFGKDQVGFADLKESYVPERSWTMSARPSSPPQTRKYFPWVRPAFLFHPPRPYSPSKSFELKPSENLAAEWWEEGGCHRRYFIAEQPHGEKLWVFWDSQKQAWFLHGTFD